ncbi:hypothetical protein BC629DRAFT_1591950 [Irpex lacteus]|nr:hypothetical protein BC629DRAFT_1591950 [Irpex lacteus]
MSQNPAVAQHPFDIDTADIQVIIRTSDDVYFYVFRAVLILASPFFRDMFSLKQPDPAVPTSESDRIVTAPDSHVDPIIITETSQTFDCLMRICYPIDDPIMNDLSLVESVLEAAQKYDMAWAVKVASKCLQGFVQSHALDVYAIACRLKAAEEAKLAAEAWYNQSKSLRSGSSHNRPFEATVSGGSFGAKMGNVSAGVYYRLLYYLRNGKISHFIGGGNPSLPPTQILPSFFKQLSQPTVGRCLHDIAGADVLLLSQDQVQFPAHTSILHLASASKLLQGITIKPTKSKPTLSPIAPDELNLPAIPVGLHSRPLAELLRLCYPVEHFDLSDFALFKSVYTAAKQWQVTKIISSIRKEFRALMNHYSDLLYFYFIAMEQDWIDEARESASLIAQKMLQDTYIPEMEDHGATAYHRLLKFCHNHTTQMRSAVSAEASRCADNDFFQSPSGLLHTQPIMLAVAMIDLIPRISGYAVTSTAQSLVARNQRLNDEIMKLSEIDL